MTELKKLDNFHAGMLPEATKQRLEYYGQLGEKQHWGIAREVERIIDELEAEGIEPPMMQLYAAVGEVSYSAAESVRGWFQIYKEIPKPIFDEYVESGADAGSQTLSFHQHKALVPHVDGKGVERVNEYENLIQRWFDFCARENRSPSSVDGIRAWVAGEYGAPSPELGRFKRYATNMVKLIGNPSVPEAVRQELIRHKDKLNDLSTRYPNLGDWGVSDD